MYYLHLFDTIRGGIIVVDDKPEPESITLEINDAPIVYSDGTPYAPKKGWTLGPVETRNEAETLSLAIASRYNYDIEIDGKLIGYPYISASEAARAMGKIGGASKSESKRAAVRENGKKGGRPRKG